MNNRNIIVSVIGAAGYSGVELVRILTKHPVVSIGALVANSNAGKKLSDISLHAKNEAKMFETYSPEAIASSDLVFVALPSGEGFEIISDLTSQGKSVIDLGGDFRLQNTSEYKKYYGRDHQHQNLLNKAIYGMPELNRDSIATSQFISNPGCYATSIILPLVPLVKSAVISDSHIVVNSYSGISGAGKKNTFEYSFTELNDSIQAYKANGSHQHIPEIKQGVRQFGGSDISFTFVPHLAPITRGIHTTVTAPLMPGITANDVLTAFHEQYKDEPFVALSPDVPPALKRVQHTNMIEIGWNINADTNTLVIFSAIDNLMKGAAGQAVQNMNIMCGFEETMGL